MKIYDSKNLTDLGKAVIIQKAGAARVVVENKAAETKQVIDEE